MSRTLGAGRPAVVVPCYRAAGILPVTMPAFRAQTLAADWIFVDDGSDDATGALLEREVTRPFAAAGATARVLHLVVNSGRAAARNAGLAVLPPQADPVVFLDVDTEPDADLLQRFVHVLAEPETVAVVGQIRAVGGDPHDPYVHYLGSSLRGARAPGPAHWRHFLTTAAAVRRDALDAAGSFDPRLSYGEDLDLAARLGARDPDGLRVAPGPPVPMHEPGTLDTALDKLTEFARDNLPFMLDRHPHLAAWTRADLAARPTVRAALAPSRIVRRFVRWLPVGNVSDFAVRYLLAATFTGALRAGQRAPTFEFYGSAGDSTDASAWVGRCLRREAPELADRVALAAAEAVDNVVAHGTPPGRLTIRRENGAWVLDVVEAGAGPPGEAVERAALPETESTTGRGLYLLHRLADRVERRAGHLRLTFRSIK